MTTTEGSTGRRTLEHCNCQLINDREGTPSINMCPLHRNAWALLEALRRIETAKLIEEQGAGDAASMTMDDALSLARAVIEDATS